MSFRFGGLFRGWNRKRKNDGTATSQDEGSWRFWSRNRSTQAEGVPSGIIRIKDKSLIERPPALDDKRWQEVGTVDRLYIHPLKSGRGNSVKSAKVEKYCLRHEDERDRQFVIVDRMNMFVSARKYPKLVLVETEVEGNRASFRAPDAPRLTVQLPERGDVVRTSIFFQDCEGLDLGKEASCWISKFIGNQRFEPFRILYNPYDPVKRPRNDRQNGLARNRDLVPNSRLDDTSLYADHYGFTVMTSQSIKELNRRLRDRDVDLVVEQRRFRPNIYVKNHGRPFEEDHWIFIKINDTVFRMARYSTRCIFTTIDPDSGSKNRQFEPMKTLKTFRSSLDQREKSVFGSAPFFGINLGLEGRGGGKVRLDEKVFVICNDAQ